MLMNYELNAGKKSPWFEDDEEGFQWWKEMLVMFARLGRTG
jgi:hypothetical protein